MIRRSPIPWIVISLALLAGCAEAPTEKLEQVEKAMADARAAEAKQYAPEAWADLRDQQVRLQAELKAQKNKLGVRRSYDETEKLAEQTRQAAEDAAATAIAAKEQVRGEAFALIADARVKLEELHELIKGAPRGKGSDADLAVLKSDAGELKLTIDAGEEAYEMGDYLTAKVKAEAAIRTVEEIKAEIESAKRMSGRTAS